MAKKEIEELEAEESNVETIATLSVDLDIERTAKEQALKEKQDLEKKVSDLSKANARLMKRVSEKNDNEDKQENDTKEYKNAKLSDIYDFTKGRLVLKK